MGRNIAFNAPVSSITFMWLILFLAQQAISGQAKIGYFWHISDLHFDSAYSTKGDIHRSCWHTEHHQSTSSRNPGRFGDYLCDSPWSLLESATQAMKIRQGDNVEFVLWTGDGLSHSARRAHETHRLDLLRNITELLGRTFSSQFVFPVLGHEDGQNGDFSRLGELWRQWLPSEALQTFEKGGYYTIEQTKSRLRIIALNTNFMRHDARYLQTHSAAVRQRPGSTTGDAGDYNNYYYHHGGGNYYQTGNSGSAAGSTIRGASATSAAAGAAAGAAAAVGNNAGGTVSALSGSGESHESQKQWEWLEDVLAKSSKNKETVYIVGHIPPGSDERQVNSLPNGHTAFSEKNNLRYLRLVRKYSQIIQGQFFGHLHSDSFRIVYNDVGKPVSWMMIAPAITPRKMNVGPNNPAMRLYKFETVTGQVIDYTQYYLDLTAANMLGEAVWQPEYNLTTHYYGLDEVSSVALHNLADRFTNSDDPLFAKYYRANSVRYPNVPCEGVCALNHYCAITRVDYREFRQCLETAASALASGSRCPSPPLLQFAFVVPILWAMQHHHHHHHHSNLHQQHHRCRRIVHCAILVGAIVTLVDCVRRSIVLCFDLCAKLLIGFIVVVTTLRHFSRTLLLQRIRPSLTVSTSASSSSSTSLCSSMVGGRANNLSANCNCDIDNGTVQPNIIRHSFYERLISTIIEFKSVALKYWHSQFVAPLCRHTELVFRFLNVCFTMFVCCVHFVCVSMCEWKRHSNNYRSHEHRQSMQSTSVRHDSERRPQHHN